MSVHQIEPPKPDDSLTAWEAALWNRIVGSKPSDWFGPEHHELLIGYCKHASRARHFDELHFALRRSAAD